jgi:gluconate 2-dehydrogenase subunit 3-like protein
VSRPERDPYELPRQRRGTTPQMHGRYPDYDVLEQSGHWDEATRKVVLDRVENVPEIRFFDALEARALKAFCDVVTAQDSEPRIPVLSYVDDKLYSGRLDGYQYYDLPDDRELWKLVARGLDEEARRRGAPSYADAGADLQEAIVADFADAKLHGGVWGTFSVSRAWTILTGHIVQAFYAHPWAWNEIGFGGPAYPRGYSRFGSPHLDKAEREEWEGEEHDARDPAQERA